MDCVRCFRGLLHHYRTVLLRMRQGDSDRDIADAKIIGRSKAAQ